MTMAMLLVALVVILIAAEFFTNALEHVGDRLKISEGVTGSIFAAVGTAMPEAIVPIVAIFSTVGSETTRHEVGVGAILGAPLLLSTLALFLVAVFAAQKRGWRGEFHPERSGVMRDLHWFVAAFSLAAVAMFIPRSIVWARYTIGIVLVMMYFLYILVTVRASSKLVADGHVTEADQPLYLVRLLGALGFKENWFTILVQLALGLGGIVYGAHVFVHEVGTLSTMLGISALILAVLIVPLATEMPEKVNSILWIRRRKDTLAFGNLTGAMVFQGTLLPAIGIMLTPWDLRPAVLVGVALTLMSTIYLTIMFRRGVLRPIHLLLNGACYFAYIPIVLIWR